MGVRAGSFLGRFFRRLADFFDAQPAQSKPQTSLSRGSALEVDIITLTLVFTGLTVAGTWIHGLHFLLWNLLFALCFCAGTWIIFRSARWSTQARSLLLASVLLLSATAASQRIVALGAFIFLFALMLRGLWIGAFMRRETLSVAAVALFCFSAYDGFSAVLEWRRNATLTVGEAIPMGCQPKNTGNICKAGDVSFLVPDFWRPAHGSNLIKDLSSVLPLRIYADSATDNSVAFGAFSASGEQVMQKLANFLAAQKSFLRSKTGNKDPLAPQRMMSSADTALYGLRYESATAPGYLAATQESTALLLTHQRRSVTWFFIVDGTDISAREFILHRIMSGFH